VEEDIPHDAVSSSSFLVVDHSRVRRSATEVYIQYCFSAGARFELLHATPARPTVVLGSRRQ
jgi:hypothetical protein